jgi:DNA-3-methyladenine glycosylase
MLKGKILNKDFFARSVVEVAKDLVGKILVRKVKKKYLVGRIVEVEAYGASDDAASHACKKQTDRNAPMFGPVGRAYVYFTYGKHCCLNITARDPEAKAGGVLIRALDPILGLEDMIKFRGTDDLENLVSGPGKLAEALDIDLKMNNLDITKEGSLFLLKDSATPASAILATPRVGIRSAKDKKWRFTFK